MNGYAQHLRDLGALLWLVRIILLVTVLLHIYFTILLAIENRRARPKGYAKKENVKASFASRHMVVSGLVVFAFIVFHLLHFTVRKIDPRFPLLKNDPLNHYDVYSMMVYGFSERLRLDVLRHRTFLAHAASYSRLFELLSVVRLE